MQSLRFAIVMTGLMFLTHPLHADDAVARALVDKAIAAQGGAEKLAKWQANSAQFKGTFHGMGQALEYTGNITTQGPDQMRFVIEFDAGGQKFSIIQVLNGDKGWTKFNDQVNVLDKDQLAEAQEKAHAEWAATLIPLKDKKFTLRATGEVEIEKRPALGVLVSCKGRRDFTLYFDKQTNLRVKTESRAKVDATGQEVSEESYYSEYKEFQGVKHATKFVVKRDGKLFVDGEVTELQLAEKLDKSTFDKP